MAAYGSSGGADEIDRLLAEADGLDGLDESESGIAREGGGDGRFPEVNEDYQQLKQAMVNEMVRGLAWRALAPRCCPRGLFLNVRRPGCLAWRPAPPRPRLATCPFARRLPRTCFRTRPTWYGRPAAC